MALQNHYTFPNIFMDVGTALVLLKRLEGEHAVRSFLTIIYISLEPSAPQKALRHKDSDYEGLAPREAGMRELS